LKINTSRFGTIRIKEEKIITMPFGMLGFPDKKRFVIFQHKTDSPFFWYQSVDDPALAFVIANPYLFMPDYQVQLDDILKEMPWNGDGGNDQVELYIVVNIPKGSPHKMTGNLIGPILINNRVCQAVQVVISDSAYTHKQLLLKDKP